MSTSRPRGPGYPFCAAPRERVAEPRDELKAGGAAAHDDDPVRYRGRSRAPSGALERTLALTPLDIVETSGCGMRPAYPRRAYLPSRRTEPSAAHGPCAERLKSGSSSSFASAGLDAADAARWQRRRRARMRAATRPSVVRAHDRSRTSCDPQSIESVSTASTAASAAASPSRVISPSAGRFQSQQSMSAAAR